MINLHDISYIHASGDVLFDHINLTVNNHNKVALIGNNGTGKSTLLKIIAGELFPATGSVSIEAKPYYVPQIFGQYAHVTIAEALQIDGKLKSLKEIMRGNASEENFTLLGDDWSIEERCQQALSYWQLDDLDLSQNMSKLSGGQKTKVFLSAVSIHQPELILLDEPSNHLDMSGRQLLYDFIQSSKSTLIIVSHDRKLLNLPDTICELTKYGIKTYGGNYEFYAEQKQIHNDALNETIQAKEKTLRKAKEKERETLERQQKLDARGKGKQEKAGVARIMMNTLRNNAEKSTSKIKSLHEEKIAGIANELGELRSALPDIDKMKFGFDNSSLHEGKILFKATSINFAYDKAMLWSDDLDFQITSGERIALKGRNGSGKTTLIRLMLGEIEPQTGAFYRAAGKSVYIDQDYSLIDNKLSVYEQAQQFNLSLLQEHEVKIRLNRFLFTKEDWDKPCSVLSGGERMRLILCCLTIQSHAPDVIVLDEPINNLDIQNIEILTSSINEYDGTLIVVSHDETFMEKINVKREIYL